jgi:HEAT repeat protein
VRRRQLLLLGLVLLLVAPGLLRAAGSRPSIADLVARNDLKTLEALGPAALPELIRLYKAGGEEQKIRVAGILNSLGMLSREAEQALLQDVHTQNVELRVAVQYALGRISDDPQVVDTLLAIMRNDRSPIFRDKAACALSYDQTHLTARQRLRLYEGLIDALGDPKRQVQLIAVTALQILTGQDKGFRISDPPETKQKSMEAWRRWLAEYRANL